MHKLFRQSFLRLKEIFATTENGVRFLTTFFKAMYINHMDHIAARHLGSLWRPFHTADDSLQGIPISRNLPPHTQRSLSNSWGTSRRKSSKRWKDGPVWRNSNEVDLPPGLWCFLFLSVQCHRWLLCCSLYHTTGDPSTSTHSRKPSHDHHLLIRYRSDWRKLLERPQLPGLVNRRMVDFVCSKIGRGNETIEFFRTIRNINACILEVLLLNRCNMFTHRYPKPCTQPILFH